MSISAVSAGSRAFAAQATQNEYTIQRGDTLSGIAARHGVSLQSLLAANPRIANPDVIYPGQTLTIPSGGQAGGSGGTQGSQGPSGVSGSTPGALQGRINEAMGFFESKGWTRAQAAGIVGNLQAESGVDPNRRQNGGGPGYGLAQWEGPRQADFKAWAGKDIHQSTFREQLEFIQHELTTTERGAGNALKGATTAADAARIVCTKYERPGIPHLESRIANANAIFNNASPTKPAPGSSTPAPSNPNPSPAKPNAGGDYTVRSGDTMSGIAARHGVSLATLVAANPQIKNPNLIQVGQTVHLPGGSGAAAPASSNYTVRSGDTMSGIAARHGVSLATLVAANPQIRNPNLIQVGQTVHIPGSGGGKSATGGNYTVRSGDTMAGIASRHGVSLAALKAANPQIGNINLIHPGQTVHIPAGGSAQGPSKPAGPGGSTGVNGPSGASGSKAADIAKQFLGRNASELKRSGALPMNPNVPSNICCANFVSAVLQKAGLLNVHTDLVSGSSKTGRGVNGSIGQILKDRGWKVVDAAHAKPGDVAIVNNGHHVEMVYSNKGGDVTLIGSNNINKDGTQQISYGKPYGGAWYLTPP